MNSKNLWFAAAFIAAVCCNAALAIEKPTIQPVSGRIKWVYDYDKGKQASRTTGKPLFVVFRCER